MVLRAELLTALDDAEKEVEKERNRIVVLTKGKPEPLSREIWDEESSVLLPYFMEEIEVAETSLILHDAKQYHLSVPGWSDKDAWEVSRMSHGRFLVPEKRRHLQRALLEERRREADHQSAKWGLYIGILGLFVAALALLKDVPLGTFLIDLIEAVKAE